MPLLTASKLAVSYGDFDLFSDVALEVAERARIGLVGPNGGGKTSLLKVLVGEQQPNAGQVYRAGGVRVGYVPQVNRAATSGTLRDEVMVAFEELLALERAVADAAVEVTRSGGDAERRYAIAAVPLRGRRRLRLREQHAARRGRRRAGRQDAGQLGRDGERRRAHQGRARPRPAQRPRPARARRADQLPRLQGARLAGGLSPQDPPRLRRRLPRPVLPRRGGDPDLGPGARQPEVLLGQLHEVPGVEGRAAGPAGQGVRAATGVYRQGAVVHRPLPGRPTLEGGPRPGDEAETAGARRRAAARPAEHSRREERHREDAEGRRQRPGPDGRRDRRRRSGRARLDARADAGARLAHGDHRRERRRQDDAPADAARRAPPAARIGDAGRPRPRRLPPPGQRRPARPGRRPRGDAGRSGTSRPRRSGSTSPGSSSTATMSSRTCRRSAAASARGWPSPG